MSALLLADSICGDFLVEWIFARPGLGTLLWKAIRVNDVPLATGILSVGTLLFSCAMIALNLAYGSLDPRIRRVRGAA